MHKPKYLYQYQCIGEPGKPGEHTLSNLENRVIFLKKPREFNDPFEFKIETHKPSEDDWYNFFDEIGKPSDLNLKNDFIEEFERSFTRIVDWLKNECGVACFLEYYSNILMWSHYAAGHTGICLQFDTDCDPFSVVDALIPINYKKEIPIVNPLIILRTLLFDNALKQENEMQKIIFPLLNTKYCCWSYEKEWRLMARNKDVPTDMSGWTSDVNEQALKAVYLGWKIKHDHEVRILDIVKGSNVEVYKMNIDQGKYSVLAKPLDLVRNKSK